VSSLGSVIATLFGRRWHFYYPYHLSYFAPGTRRRAAGVGAAESSVHD
jgi:hypothetical protein